MLNPLSKITHLLRRMMMVSRKKFGPPIPVLTVTSNLDTVSQRLHQDAQEQTAMPLQTLSRWHNFTDRVSDYLELVKRLIKARKVLEFLIQEETCLVIFSCFMAASAVFIALSFQPPSPNQDNVQSNSDFYANISQAILSVLTVYLTILPTLRSKTLGLRYRFWFWTCLLTSAVSSVLNLGFYTAFPLVSSVFGWISTWAQVVLTLLLTLSIQNASKEGSIDSIELHVN
jgi:hypothetical protein